MIKRIVKLTFREDSVPDFLDIFTNSKARIRNFPGCYHLELWQDTQHPNTFFTYSFWKDEAALNEYRHSELFRATWKQTKVLFAEQAQAWSVQKM